MAESKKGDRSAWWLALVGALGAALGAGITGGFSYLGQKGDLDAKMIELSLGILRAKPTPETEPLREWAIAAIQKQATLRLMMRKRKRCLSSRCRSFLITRSAVQYRGPSSRRPHTKFQAVAFGP